MEEEKRRRIAVKSIYIHFFTFDSSYNDRKENETK
jgi:hypothetical protein